MIQQKVDEANTSFFSACNLHLDVLKNCPQVIPTLARWLYDTRDPYDAFLTKEKLIHSFETRLHCDKTPVTFVFLENNTSIDLVPVKRQTSPELSDFPKKRNQGIGQEFDLNTRKDKVKS